MERLVDSDAVSALGEPDSDPHHEGGERPVDSDAILALRGRPGVSPAAIERALELTGQPPRPEAWRRYLDRALGGLGTLLLVAGIFFFFAYNWRDLGRFGKFSLLEGLVLGLFLGGRKLSYSSTGGQLCLTAASALIGALLAVYGQAYQTGADSYLLFATWALLAAPWVLAAEFAPLWLGWLLLVNLALILFCQQTAFPGPDPWEEPFFAFLMAGFNAMVWALGERLRPAQPWLRTPWLLPVAGLLCLFFLTWTADYQLFDAETPFTLSSLVLAGALALVVWFYRSRRRDLFFLACAAGSLIVVLTSVAIQIMGSEADEPAFWLLLACLLLAQLAMAASWLRFEARRP